MLPITKALSSSVGKKLVMALTGLALFGFVITHLAGNLSLYKGDGTTFNLYAQTLASWGWLLEVAEVGLVGLLVAHIVLALVLKGSHRSARPVGYRMLQSKGGQSLSNRSSRNMIITGAVLLAFLVLHVWQFKFGPSESAGYVTEIDGAQMRDLHRLVHETFQSPWYVAIYVGAMLMLGFHLRHGFWSAFQSLGAMNARLAKPVYALGVAIAILLAAGFLFIPIWIYCGMGGAN